jgi:hypothetical protein
MNIDIINAIMKAEHYMEVFDYGEEEILSKELVFVVMFNYIPASGNYSIMDLP